MNALTYARPTKGEYILAASTDENGAYKIVSPADTATDFERLYISDMSVGEKVLDAVAERVLDGKSRAMISVSRTLEEVGAFDKKYGLSPVMFLHRIGLLDCVDALVGGVWLDRDDADIMTQCDCPLILTPSFDMGRGNGIPEAATYLRRGLTLGLGTEDCSFNANADVGFEAKLVSLTAAASMRDPDAITAADLKKMLNFRLP